MLERRARVLRAYSASSSAVASADSSSSTPNPRIPTPERLDAAEAEIWNRLNAKFAPAELVVQDISGGCGSMYGIEIVSDAFRGQTMLKQQRMVNAVLADLMHGWHGVQLKTRTPS
jgi:BolA-like protein 3